MVVLELLRSDPVGYLEQSNSAGKYLIHIAFEGGNLVTSWSLLWNMRSFARPRELKNYAIRLHPGRVDLLELLLQAGQNFQAVINDQGQIGLHPSSCTMWLSRDL